MRESFQRWFLPERMRFLPASRAISIALRTVHLATFGVLVGGHAVSTRLTFEPPVS